MSRSSKAVRILHIGEGEADPLTLISRAKVAYLELKEIELLWDGEHDEETTQLRKAMRALVKAVGHMEISVIRSYGPARWYPRVIPNLHNVTPDFWRGGRVGSSSFSSACSSGWVSRSSRLLYSGRRISDRRTRSLRAAPRQGPHREVAREDRAGGARGDRELRLRGDARGRRGRARLRDGGR